MSKRKLSNLQRRQESVRKTQGMPVWVRDQFQRMIRLNQGIISLSGGR